MKKLRIYILLFCITASFPFAYVIWRTYEGLYQEEFAQLRFFTETLFDEMEEELAQLVRREESRAVDEYQFMLAGSAGDTVEILSRTSPLGSLPQENYILGYLQNNPDGSFQSPLVKDPTNVPYEYRNRYNQLKNVNETFNDKKLTGSLSASPPAPAKEKMKAEKNEKAGFAQRYLSRSRKKISKSYLGQEKARMEEITADQAMSLAQKDRDLFQSSEPTMDDFQRESDEETAAPAEIFPGVSEGQSRRQMSQPNIQQSRADAAAVWFQVEVAPLQSVFIDDDRIFIFRRIAIRNQIYRQGFVLEVKPFLRHLLGTHFDHQPVADFTQLKLQVINGTTNAGGVQAGVDAFQAALVSVRIFPAPFSFLKAEMRANSVPASSARRSLNVSLGILCVLTLFGLTAIYHSARTVMDLSERRSRFVSSVTHELKTPLTNIRMYIEMLDHGIAASPEQEQEYLSVLASESARLSHLINNVLELSKLEKKQRHFHLRQGKLEAVFSEAQAVMSRKLSQEGFKLEIRADNVPIFRYDHQVVVQILINLIENSIKFGRHSPKKRILITVDSDERWVNIKVSDTGPGIPQKFLKKVFDDFYRVDNDLTRNTGGTGIGLALVKKFVLAMGGRVQAFNNSGPGCTITLSLPMKTDRS